MLDISEKLVSKQEEINNVDKFIGKIIMETTETVINLQTRKSLRLLRFCIVSWKGSCTSEIQRSLEEKDWMDHHRQKLQRL